MAEIRRIWFSPEEMAGEDAFVVPVCVDGPLPDMPEPALLLRVTPQGLEIGGRVYACTRAGYVVQRVEGGWLAVTVTEQAELFVALLRAAEKAREGS